MKTKIVLQAVLAGFMVLSSQVFAGDFTALPTSGTEIRVFGANNRATDKLYLANGLSTDWVEIATRDTPIIWSGVDIRNPDGAKFTYGTFQDKVYRNSTDNTLAFGSRLSLNLDLGVSNPEFGTTPWAAYEHLFYSEANYIWRSGYNGYTTAAAWYPQNDPDTPYEIYFDPVNGGFNPEYSYNYGADFRLKIAVMSSDKFSSLGGAANNPVYNPDVVGFSTDVSTPEANPNSGWYLVKTNATNFNLLDNGGRILQDGGNGEGRATRAWSFAAFAPAAAVPEPETYAMMLTGLMLLGFSARRRSA